MKKKLTYRDKLIELAYIYDVKEIKDYELFSLKITDSLYKKDIGKFLETLSSHFI